LYAEKEEGIEQDAAVFYVETPAETGEKPRPAVMTGEKRVRTSMQLWVTRSLLTITGMLSLQCSKKPPSHVARMGVFIVLISLFEKGGWISGITLRDGGADCEQPIIVTLP
jgi:hypothetical protein